MIRVAARKEKAPGPCELRALLREEPSSPCTRHGRRRITGHRRTLRSDNASYARALDRAHNLTSLLATRPESLPITSRAGNDRNANTGVLDFMRSLTTSRHEGCVSTMLTESGWSIAPPVPHFKGPNYERGNARRKARRCGVLSVLTTWRTTGRRDGRLATRWVFGCEFHPTPDPLQGKTD